MRYVESPEVLEQKAGTTSVFLAGGITGCPDWQTEIAGELGNVDKLILLNPRRANFLTHDPGAALEQITWEHEHLRKADAILFWFPCETICPIVLYELGAWSMTDKPIFVGVHPKYQRRQDVEIQTDLTRPDVEIVYSLQELADQVTQRLPEYLDDPVDTERLHCCKVGCATPAEWEIAWGPTPDDYTHACTAHVGALLDDHDVFTVYPAEVLSEAGVA